MEAKTLALYLGCRVRATFDTGEYVQGMIEMVGTECATFTHQIPDYYFDEPDFKLHLLLRPLTTLTAQEQIDCQHETTLLKDHYRSKAMCTVYLLRNNFDLFGLIEKGEAIDATKVEKVNEI